MLPVIVAGVMAASAVAQWLNSEQARRASAKELEKMLSLYENLQDPSFSPENLSPDEFQVAAKFTPNVASFISEKDPTIVQRTAEYNRGREAELNALSRFAGIAENGYDPRFQTAMEQAGRRSQMETRSAMDSISQRMAERGMLGSGIQAAMESDAASESADRAAMTGQNAANAAYEAQLRALTQSADIGRNVENAEFSREKTNADIINEFNSRLAGRRQQVELANQNARNEASRFNAGAENDAGFRTTAARNNAKEFNLNRDDTNRRFKSTYAMQKLNPMVNIMGDKSQNNIGRAQDQNQAIQGLGNAVGSVAMHEQARMDSGATENRADQREFFRKNGRWPEDGEIRYTNY